MIGVTIGIGAGWKERAQWAAERMRRMTGIKCITYESDLFEGVAHPSWLKCQVAMIQLDFHDSIMIFDADILPMKPWNPVELFERSGRRFMAARDEDSHIVRDECDAFDIPQGQYYNGGLTIFGREHASVWEHTWKRHPNYGSWLEQTALNKALHETGTRVAELPRAYNTLLWPGRDRYDRESLMARHAVNLHAASLGGDHEALRGIQEEAS